MGQLLPLSSFWRIPPSSAQGLYGTTPAPAAAPFWKPRAHLADVLSARNGSHDHSQLHGRLGSHLCIVHCRAQPKTGESGCGKAMGNPCPGRTGQCRTRPGQVSLPLVRQPRAPAGRPASWGLGTLRPGDGRRPRGRGRRERVLQGLARCPEERPVRLTPGPAEAQRRAAGSTV